MSHYYLYIRPSWWTFWTLKSLNSEICKLHSEICVWKIKLLTMKRYLNLNLSPIPLCRFVCDQEIMKLNKICLSFVDRKTSSTHWILAKTFCLMWFWALCRVLTQHIFTYHNSFSAINAVVFVITSIKSNAYNESKS